MTQTVNAGASNERVLQEPSTNRQGTRVVTTVGELQAAFAECREGARRTGLVPTMGALHAGHLSLVRAARQECDATVVTIFVNPTQFGPREDLARYPRTLEADLKLLEAEQVDLVFVPSAGEIYPPGFSTYVDPPAAAVPLEGIHRPGHFRGVTTVVLKLFHLIPADIAFLGQKDYQQCLVIRRMVADLNVPLEIRMCPTVRESDGLALSSRNSYLNAEERRRAVAISRALEAGRSLFASGERTPSRLQAAMRQVLHDAGIERIDYAAAVNAETLLEQAPLPGHTALLIAAFVGETRLIDNCLIG